MKNKAEPWKSFTINFGKWMVYNSGTWEMYLCEMQFYCIFFLSHTVVKPFIMLMPILHKTNLTNTKQCDENKVREICFI